MKEFSLSRNYMVFLLVLCVAFIPVLLDGQDDGGMLGDFFLPEYALANDGAGGVDVEMDGDGNIILEGGDVDFQGTSRSSWNTLFGRYKNIITGFSGIATLTMLAAFIFLLTKLGATSGNDKARRDCLTGILFTGLATAGLGSVTIIMAFFYNAFAGL